MIIDGGESPQSPFLQVTFNCVGSTTTPHRSNRLAFFRLWFPDGVSLENLATAKTDFNPEIKVSFEFEEKDGDRIMKWRCNSCRKQALILESEYMGIVKTRILENPANLKLEVNLQR